MHNTAWTLFLVMSLGCAEKWSDNQENQLEQISVELTEKINLRTNYLQSELNPHYS